MMAPSPPLPQRMIHEIIPVGWLQCNCSILGDPETREALVLPRMPHFCGKRKNGPSPISREEVMALATGAKLRGVIVGP